MNQYLSQNLWSQPHGSGNLWLGILITLAIGIGIVFAISQVPANLRRPITIGFTFIAGLFYFLLWIFPKSAGRADGDQASDLQDTVSFFLEDGASVFGSLSNILVSFLLLLGVFSLFRIHITKVFKQQKDWVFSLVLLGSLMTIAIVGYMQWNAELNYTPAQIEAYVLKENWPKLKWTQDFLFDGLLQAMDAAMFSLIAFYILSAAYRAFRIRSIEATVLLASALIMMLSLLGMAEYFWSNGINTVTDGNPSHFMTNFKLDEIAGFIRSAFQVPGLRAIDFGVGVGTLAMAIRLWLGLEKGGVSS